MPVAANVTDNFPTWNITVNDTNPLWFYVRLPPFLRTVDAS